MVSVIASIVGMTGGTATIGLGAVDRNGVTVGFGVAGHYTSAAAGIFDEATDLAKNLSGLGKVLAIGQLAWDFYGALKEEKCFG